MAGASEDITLPIHSIGGRVTTISEDRLDCPKRRALTAKLIARLESGTAPLDEISMSTWLQLAFLHCIDTGLIHLEQPVIYGGQHFNLHMCIDRIGPSYSLDDAVSNKH